MSDTEPIRVLVLADEFGREHQLTPAIMERLARNAEVTLLGDQDDEQLFLGELGRSTALLVAGWETRPPRLDSEQLAALTRLRMIGCGQDGRWRFVDAREALRRGIVCTDSSGVMGTLVAEFAVALTLSVLRDLPRQHALVAAGGWSEEWEDAGATPAFHELHGRRVGLVGFGGIGSHLASLFRAAGCRVSVFSSWLNESTALTHGVSIAASVRELAAASDILIVATQPRADTAGIVDRAALAALPDDAVVVLVGRAATVDVEALLEHVGRGRLRLGIDVYPQEPLPLRHPLRGLPGVVHTAHVAGRTLSAHRMIFEELVGDLELVLAGLPARWAVNAARLERVLAPRGSGRPKGRAL